MVVPIGPLAWEPPYAAGVALKSNGVPVVAQRVKKKNEIMSFVAMWVQLEIII